MIETIQGLPDGVVGLKATGTVTEEDYRTVVDPLLDGVRERGERLRFLFHFDGAFEGFTAGAAWEDFKVGMRNLLRIERCAVVADKGWVRAVTKTMGVLIPGRVRTYTSDGLQSAIDWLAATGKGAHLSYRALHDQGVLVVGPKGPLSDADFDRLAAVVDPWIEGAGDLKGLVIHAAKFPGWEDLGSFFQHMRFVRGHHKKVARVALAVDGAMIQRLAGIGDHFIAAEVRPFATDDLDQAITWAAGTDAT